MSNSPPNDDHPGRRLMEAVRLGDVQTVSKMVDEFGLSYSDDWLGGFILVRHALMNDQVEVAKLLLTKNAEINSQQREFPETLLHIAAQSGATQIVEMLLNRGAYVDARNWHGQTPLHHAAKNLEILRLLLDRNATVYLKDNTGSTALSVAISKSNLATVEELLNHFSKLDKFGKPDLNRLLCEAAQWSNVAMVRLLLRDSPEINFANQHEESLLHCAAKYGQDEIIKMFLDRGADINMPDKEGKTVLHAAIQSEHLQTDDSGVYWVNQDSEKRPYLTIIKKILSFCPDVTNEVNRHTLSKAITRHGDIEKCEPHCHMMIPVVDALLCYGLTVRPEDAEDGVFLYEAIKHGHLKIVDAVLKLGTDVNRMYCVRHYGFTETMTLFYMAADCNQYEIAEFLVSKGADVSIKNSKQFSPLFRAIEHRNQIMAKMIMTSTSSVEVTENDLCQAVKMLCPLVVEMILQKYPQMDVNRLDERGFTLLHHTFRLLACLPQGWCKLEPMITDTESLEARVVIAEMLLSAGAHVDAVGPLGMTPLHIAASNGYAEGVKLLLKHGADVNYKAEEGPAAITQAARIGNIPILQILLDNSADINLKQKNGLTAAHAACEFGKVDVLKFLHLNGANMDARNTQQLTPLHIATFHGYTEAVQTLLRFRVDIDAKNDSGNTALHIAICMAWPSITLVLLRHGADPFAKGDDLLLPINLAEFEEPDHEHVEDLKQADIPQYRLMGAIPETEFGQHVRHKIPCNKPCKILVWVTVNKFMMETIKMQHFHIGNSGVTFYHIRTHRMRKLQVYLQKQCIQDVMISKNYVSEFPMYALMIECRFKEAQLRNMMSSQALEALDVLTSRRLPKEMRDLVLEYISVYDVKSLIFSVYSSSVVPSGVTTGPY